MNEMELDAVPLRDLEFDLKNPRLREEDRGSPVDCAQALLDEHDPIDIGRSMAAFGFFITEPLIVLRPDGAVAPFPVMEGNRRLLAMRLLLDSDLREALEAGSNWTKEASNLKETGLLSFETKIPVVVTTERAAAYPPIGFRHIVGIKKWGAFEKAAFLNQLVASQRQTSPAPFDAVSELVSESVGEVQRAVRDYRALLAMERAIGARLERAREDFGSFARFVQAGGTRAFVGLTTPGKVSSSPEDPVLTAGTEEIRILASLLYGLDNAPPVVSDSRQATDLGKVLRVTRPVRSCLIPGILHRPSS